MFIADILFHLCTQTRMTSVCDIVLYKHAFPYLRHKRVQHVTWPFSCMTFSSNNCNISPTLDLNLIRAFFIVEEPEPTFLCRASLFQIYWKVFKH